MPSYAKYCQEHATACARRARLASSPEVVAAQQEHETDGALGYESGVTAPLFPLHDKPAVYPIEYTRRAEELIARTARSLHRFRHMNSPSREGHRPKPNNLLKPSAYNPRCLQRHLRSPARLMCLL
jgi:hypothetical protein